ncbi:transcriptional regulator [Candidatus Scalindua japonica]|uniref:Transcriptional regulator n=1 Tax=Candidatus Scalindua japonica TaxID=1284222 RepID=A0A286TZE4_9BACT|nr:transcriptional regulator [Candidatus Scalindua japonica]
MFEAYNWPGNIRELKNQVERLIILSGINNKIEATLLPPHMKSNAFSVKHERRKSTRSSVKNILRTVERKVIENELKNANWNKTIASRKLGISRASLNNKIENFNILRHMLC